MAHDQQDLPPLPGEAVENQMAHSKRNTSRAVFTSHERALAKSNWSTGSARLNRDSFLPFGSCGLCLGIAREPVACLHGDIFCHECALANLLAQKRDIKRTARVRRDAQQEAERIKAAEHEEDCERVVRDFETSQVGLPTTSKRGKPEIIPGELPSDALVLHPGGKNKFALDEKELSRIADEDRLKARQAIDDEKVVFPPSHPGD
ncbi:hypothetical protein DCS_06533 [Drechmeria coniospora]|uniref:Nitric oxide synthase-interacting protein zinc-finger domain-containing protein n=1 Tax=Drechmeria coniospora TaxID=98403 RepID=A0A151GBY8_DRECN|nr:hypothetical protein DCS_06533 [Drechmeria coniospora]KYK54573.1 hypothetical protein DCS_06533 [Drechmeria coniospora]